MHEEGIESIHDEQIMMADLSFLEAGADSIRDDFDFSRCPSSSSFPLSHPLIGTIEPVGLEIGFSTGETDTSSPPIEEIRFMSSLQFVGDDSRHVELTRKTQIEDLPHSPTVNGHRTTLVCDVGKTMSKMMRTKRGSKAGEPRGKYKCGKCGHSKHVKDKTGDIWIPHVCKFVKRVSSFVPASEWKGCDASTNTAAPRCKQGFVHLTSTSATNTEMERLPRPYRTVD
jgi:ribosomal protein L37AE/L43A